MPLHWPKSWETDKNQVKTWGASRSCLINSCRSLPYDDREKVCTNQKWAQKYCALFELDIVYSFSAFESFLVIKLNLTINLKKSHFLLTHQCLTSDLISAVSLTKFIVNLHEVVRQTWNNLKPGVLLFHKKSIWIRAPRTKFRKCKIQQERKVKESVPWASKDFIS